MQISKLSLELSTVKHEEAERLYKAQKLTGFVDLGRSLDQDESADPPNDLPIDFDDTKGSIKSSSRNEGKKVIRDISRRQRDSHSVPDDQSRSYHRSSLSTKFTRIQERPLSVEKLQGDINTIYTDHDSDDNRQTPHQNVRSHG